MSLRYYLQVVQYSTVYCITCTLNCVEAALFLCDTNGFSTSRHDFPLNCPAAHPRSQTAADLGAMFSFFNSPEKKKGSALEQSPATLLVILPKARDDIVSLFSGESLLDGRPLHVVYCMWGDFSVSADNASGSMRVYVDVAKGPCRGVHKPDFCLVRSEVRGVTEDLDFRNALLALMYGSVPAVNSLHSIYCFLERPVVMAELHRLQAIHGSSLFPVVRQSFFSDHRHMIYGDRFPAVVKVGHAHAGFGKMKVEDHHVMEDVVSLLSLNKNYLSAEPFINASYDLRIQKIGTKYRVFKRISLNGSWKTNTGSSALEEIEMNDTYRFWISEASKMFGGLDICTVDAIFDADENKEFIMEVNGSSSGFSPDSETLESDNLAVKHLVMSKLNDLLIL